jgi:hypothetical protein
MTSYPVKTMVSLKPKSNLGTYSDYNRDLLLQKSRRLDWRFLMPNPDLDRVAYLGPENDPMAEALLIFSRSLTRIESTRGSNVKKEFDLVVVKNPSIQALDLGARLVRPGGHLYVEAYGWSRLVKPQQLVKFCFDLLQHRASFARFWFPTHCKEIVQHLGFHMIHSYWHWPNFESCTRIIGLDETDMRTIAFSFQESGIQLFLRKALTSGLLLPEWVQFWAPYFSIVAGKDSL